MATQSTLVRALNPNQPKPGPTSSPFAVSEQANLTQFGSASIPNSIDQLNQSVNQNQAVDSANQNANRSDLISQIQRASVGGDLRHSSDPLAVDPTQTQNSLDSANQNLSRISQYGRLATGIQGNQLANDWSSKIQKLGSDYQTNLANARQSWSQPQIDQMLAQMPGAVAPGADPNNRGAQAVALAKKSLGVNYVWGGNSLTQGVDCSGLVQQVYGRIGIQLPRTSTDQAKYGKIVPNLQQALPGDLILEYSPYEPQGLQQFGHVGIYVGNGMVIEAPGTGKQVRIGPIVNMTRIVRPW